MATSRFAVVLFDCDSTLSSIEGVDELARRGGCGPDIAVLTAAAMSGEVPLEQVYARRLDLIRPGRSDLEWLGRRYVETIVDGARDTVAALRGLGKQVHVVSGGLLPPVQVLAEELGLLQDNAHAVPVYLDPGGAYAGFDTGSPLARSGGKSDVCRMLADRYGRAVAVGDGVTDMEMKQAGATVIGYGGVVSRAAVRAQADFYVESGPLTNVLPYILDDEERGRP